MDTFVCAFGDPPMYAFYHAGNSVRTSLTKCIYYAMKRVIIITVAISHEPDA